MTQGQVLIDHEDAIRRRWDNMRTNTLPANTSVAETEFIKTFDRCARRAASPSFRIDRSGNKTMITPPTNAARISTATLKRSRAFSMNWRKTRWR